MFKKEKKVGGQVGQVVGGQVGLCSEVEVKKIGFCLKIEESRGSLCTISKAQIPAKRQKGETKLFSKC